MYGRHFFVSNEKELHLWRDVLSNRGGIYLGIGAEQSYMLGGWAQAELLILLDFDQWVVDTNHVHGLLFRRASTPEEFARLWSYASRDTVRAWIKEQWPNRADHARILKVHGHALARVPRQLRTLRQRHDRLSIPFFGNDPHQYTRIRRLWQTKRVLPIRGDLTAGKTMHDVAAFARKAQMSVRVLYLSNAEDEFGYSEKHFRQNIRALPFDERSIVLHTMRHELEYFYYVYQDARGYRDWLGEPGITKWKRLFSKATLPSGTDPSSHLRVVAAPAR
jgi:hypothetical protein